MEQRIGSVRLYTVYNCIWSLRLEFKFICLAMNERKINAHTFTRPFAIPHLLVHISIHLLCLVVCWFWMCVLQCNDTQTHTHILHGCNCDSGADYFARAHISTHTHTFTKPNKPRSFSLSFYLHFAFHLVFMVYKCEMCLLLPLNKEKNFKCNETTTTTITVIIISPFVLFFFNSVRRKPFVFGCFGFCTH